MSGENLCKNGNTSLGALGALNSVTSTPSYTGGEGKKLVKTCCSYALSSPSTRSTTSLDDPPNIKLAITCKTLGRRPCKSLTIFSCSGATKALGMVTGSQRSRNLLESGRNLGRTFFGITQAVKW